ncbi:hypothetical protein JEQ12_004319 [Ovis aries]|uniref:Uncharacterized protein n=1 Tax=Ovis aries TaxID=9940 RepID=A0A836D001_SHEEP|nr:hypothetical protein JEQ12_004319 [Ovis aries]
MRSLSERTALSLGKDTNTCHEQGQTSDLYPGPEVMEQLLNPPWSLESPGLVFPAPPEPQKPSFWECCLKRYIFNKSQHILVTAESEGTCSEE